jgi:2'-5' RNA ligase
MPETSIRTFLAVELDATVRAAIATRVHVLAAAMPAVRFTAPETWHITLAFLGDLAPDQVNAAREAARAAAIGAVPFAVILGKGGFFGAQAAPRVIWLGLDGDIEQLRSLQQRVIAALSARGLGSDDQRFTPHITLARPRGPLDPQAVAALRQLVAEAGSGTRLSVEAISVMKSDLLPAGARYTCLERVPLASPSTEG